MINELLHTNHVAFLERLHYYAQCFKRSEETFDCVGSRSVFCAMLIFVQADFGQIKQQIKIKPLRSALFRSKRRGRTIIKRAGAPK